MTIEEQQDLLMAFHDGTPGNFHRVGNDIHFEVDIEYLAQMVHPEDHLFRGVLKNCQQLVLEFWLKDGEEITGDLDRINELAEDLEIFNVGVESNTLCLLCTCGRFLLQCDAIELFDERGQPLSNDTLCRISRQYWDHFSAQG